MGVSTNGVLAYGYDLGGGEAEWKIEGLGEYEPWEPDWLDRGEDDADDDIVTAAGEHLMRSAGFTETDWRAEGYFEREAAAKAAVGVEFKSYCSVDYPIWALVTHAITCRRGDAIPIDFAALEALRVEQGWDEKLQHALAVLGITPTQEKPCWLLLSYMG